MPEEIESDMNLPHQAAFNVDLNLAPLRRAWFSGWVDGEGSFGTQHCKQGKIKMPVVLCEYCQSIGSHDKQLENEKQISIGDVIEWSTGEFGDRGTFARGTVIKIRQWGYGHLSFLVDEEWGEQRIWHSGYKIWKVGKR